MTSYLYIIDEQNTILNVNFFQIKSATVFMAMHRTTKNLSFSSSLVGFESNQRCVGYHQVMSAIWKPSSQICSSQSNNLGWLGDHVVFQPYQKSKNNWY